MPQPILFSSDHAPSTSATQYGDVLGRLPVAWSLTEADQQALITTAGTLSYFRFELENAPGVGKSWVLTIRINETDTALTITIADTATSGSVSANVAVAVGNRISLKAVPSGTPTSAGQPKGALEFTPTDGLTQIYGNRLASLGTPDTAYDGIFYATGSVVIGGDTASERWNVVPVPGTLTGLRVRAKTAPGGSLGATFYYNKNGTRQDGSGGTVNTAVAVIGATQEASAVFALAIVASDYVYVEYVPAGGGITTVWALGHAFQPTTAGRSLLGVCEKTRIASASTAYAHPGMSGEPITATTDVLGINIKVGLTPVTLSHFYAKFDVAPGVGNSRTLILRKNGADTTITLTISGTDTTGNHTVEGVNFVAGDRFTVKVTGTGTPAAVFMTWGFAVIYEVPLSEPADPEDPDVQATGFVEICFGGSYRSWIRDRGTSRRHWFLGETWGVTARDDVDQAYNATYVNGSPAAMALPKVRGLLPEYGLAHWFDGVTSAVSFVDPGIALTVGNFSFVALCRPATAGMGLTRCVLQTGTGAGYLGLNTDNKVVFGVNGGTLLTSTEVLVAEHDYLLVGTYDGTEARLYVSELVADDPPVMNGPLGLTFTGGHGAGAIGANDGEDYFVGALQGVSVINEALVPADVVDLHETTFWTDVTDDVEIVEPLTIDQGIHGDGATDRIAGPGRCSLVLDNSHLNSGELLGYYSPDHTNVRDGFTEGIPLRVALPDPSSPSNLRIQFIGAIQSIRPTPGDFYDRRTFVLATDWLDEASRAIVTGLETQSGLRADELLRVVLNGMQNRPHAIEFDAGTDTFPFAFHNIAEKATVLSEIVNVTLSEYGLSALRWDGTFRFEARGARSSTTEAAHTITDAIDMEPERSTDQQRNIIKVTVHPATASGSLATLYEASATASPADPAVEIPVGQKAEFSFAFQDPNQPKAQIGAVNVIEPVATTDYLLNTAATGGGGDVTGNSNIAIEWVIESTRVKLIVTNNYGDPVYLTYLRVRGYPIFTYDAVTLEEVDRDSVARKGQRELTLDMPYQASTGVGLGMAQYLKGIYANVETRMKRVTFKMVESAAHLTAGLDADFSARVALSEVVSGVDGEYFVNGRRVEWHGPAADEDGNTVDNIDITWFPVPVGSGGGGYWILETSTLDESTVLGF